MDYKFRFIFISLIFCNVYANDNNPTVTTKLGDIRGNVLQTSNGKKYNAFTAIPYAKPPIGDLRFRSPLAVEPWDGVRDATIKHPECPQIELFIKDSKPFGEEDCLYLNVFVPLFSSTEEKFPVMFYVHGGSWNSGSANQYGADLILDEDVVLVTVNYRLGPLGFLTTGTTHAIGNYGLKDQALALKWVKENIGSFGGDPESVTVFGHSAGGTNAHFLMLSPMTKNLIKGVISQSSTAFGYGSILPHYLSTRRSKLLAADVGCPVRYIDDMMDCLRKINVDDIIKQTVAYLEWNVDPVAYFKPVVEPNIPGAFLPEEPINIFKSGEAANVPFMTGITTDEGGLRLAALLHQPELLKELDTNFSTIAPLTLQFREIGTQKYRRLATPKIREFYFQKKPIDTSSKTEIIQMYGDAYYLTGADISVTLHAKFLKQPTYYYSFGYKGSKSYCDLVDPSNDYGVCHADELLYLFNQDTVFPDYKPTSSDEKMSKFLVKLWTNFAKYGNPTPETDSSISVKWEPVGNGRQNYYNIKEDGSAELARDLFKERAKFWRDLEMGQRSIIIRDEL